MSGYKPYPKYKESGVEWLGEVPEHWEVKTIRRIANDVQTGSTPSSAHSSEESEKIFPWYTPGDFNNDLRISDSARKVSPSAVDSGEVKCFPPDSVLIVSIGATLGKVGITLTPCSANQQINVVVPCANIIGMFLAYSLYVKVDVMRSLSNASTIGIMNQEKTGSFAL